MGKFLHDIDPLFIVLALSRASQILTLNFFLLQVKHAYFFRPLLTLSVPSHRVSRRLYINCPCNVASLKPEKKKKTRQGSILFRGKFNSVRNVISWKVRTSCSVRSVQLRGSCMQLERARVLTWLSLGCTANGST